MSNFDDIKKKYSTTSIKKKEIKKEEKKSDVEIDENFKSPIISFMGHVDAGKTSLIDLIKHTNIQGKESGGITQTVSSEFVSIEDIREITKNIKGKYQTKHQIPGVLVLDTPGHSAFSNMREQGGNLSDLALVIIDINDGVKPQTEESIKLLLKTNTPFIIVATKIDTIYGWNNSNQYNLKKAIKQQEQNTQHMLTAAIEDLKFELEKIDVKSEFYFNNKSPKNIYSIVPISSKTKEGLSDLLSLIVFISQNWMKKKIKFKDTLEATVLKSDFNKNTGWTLKIIISNGKLQVGNKIIIQTFKGPVISTIRNIKINNNPVKCAKATQIIDIMGSNLENVISGSTISLVENNSSDALIEAQKSFDNYLNKYNFNPSGIILVSPTIGEFDACYRLIQEEKIPMLKGEINKLSLKHMDKLSTCFNPNTDREYNTILYYDNEINKYKNTLDKIKKELNEKNINLVYNDVIYHLVDQYNQLKTKLIENRKNENKKNGQAIFPCVLKILKDHIYLNGGLKDDLLFGVKVITGKLNKNTPLITESGIYLGIVTSIQRNHEEKNIAFKNDEVCIRITNETNIMYGRHFNHEDVIIAKLNRNSIDILKKDFRNEMTKKDWMLVVDHMKKLNIEKN